MLEHKVSRRLGGMNREGLATYSMHIHAYISQHALSMHEDCEYGTFAMSVCSKYGV